ncbi:hypothetical protein QWJ90_05810 [Microbacterium oryzae]|uniref:DUF7882 family protein n=1 Tax=Microbacterium oryzae TaxID=743009 RepID=UPI0025AF241F|nr:hypothetical protein [Microbacterium oryzae]MDN3310437.1 hypothetical protein [Microbacterium oryzae]
MGKMFYGMSDQPIEIEDRLLAHVQSVVLTKLRRGESFSLSWQHSQGGRETIWVHSAIPFRIILDEVEQVPLNREILVRLVEAANSNHGLDLSPSALAEIEGKAAPRAAFLARAA